MRSPEPQKKLMPNTVAGRARVLSRSLLLLAAFLACGCQKGYHVDDPQLKPIQEMIETQLPMGSTSDRVTNFLSVRGYELQPPEKPGTLVTIIRHIDTQTVRPVTARVTFYFDASGRLNAVELTRVPNQPIPQ
jgi:hypothetical protein